MWAEREREKLPAYSYTLYHNLGPAVHHNNRSTPHGRQGRKLFDPPAHTDAWGVVCLRYVGTKYATNTSTPAAQVHRKTSTGSRCEPPCPVWSRVRSCLMTCKHRRKCSTIPPKMSDRRYVYSMARLRPYCTCSARQAALPGMQGRTRTGKQPQNSLGVRGGTLHRHFLSQKIFPRAKYTMWRMYGYTGFYQGISKARLRYRRCI